MQLRKEEQETIIRWDVADGITTIYTNNVKLQNRMSRYVIKHPEIARLLSSDGMGGMTFEIPKKRLAIYPIEPTSEQQRQASRERLLQMHKRNAVLRVDCPTGPQGV